ncbi:hypothetical protein ACWFR1_36045 [Streptomyces sp. NPDC055103]
MMVAQAREQGKDVYHSLDAVPAVIPAVVPTAAPTVTPGAAR